ncbi:MAG: SusD/RagB family nutrient-binding outer membrane lipoprotein [Bacteroidales bacterium]|nr:SusD/RagB family nutrient-binding outer membrane lipoprotein [Bacteroidales bacterium]
MKIIKYLSLALILIIGVSQCKLPDNVDPKHPTEVPYYTLFTNGQLGMINQTEETSVNVNIQRLTVQFWQETTYFDESRYLYQDRKIPDGFAREYYRDALMDLKEAKSILMDENYGGDPDEAKNMIAIIDVCEVYCYQVLVDAFGNMPYTEALMGFENSAPVYDDAAAIYTDLIVRLRDDLATFNPAFGSFGSADLIYSGDVAAWKKFAASLLLRVGMRLSDVSPDQAKAAVTDAVSAGVFTSQAESGFVFYPGIVPHVNQINDAFRSGRKDFLPTNTIVDMMLEKGDPRIGKYFTMVDTSSYDSIQHFVYLGAVAGLDGAQSYNNFSNFSARTMSPSFEANMIDMVEVHFLLAEAAQRGFGVPGTAEAHYNAGVTTSIIYWGGTEEEATAYLEANPYDATNWKQSIGEQKWLALYNRGVEAFSEWRRLDYPILNVPQGMVYSDIPLRMPYPYDEVAQNKVNYEQAAAAIGGDKTSTPIFWDVVPSPAK